MILPEYIIQPSPEKCMPKLYAYLALKYTKELNQGKTFYIFRYTFNVIKIIQLNKVVDNDSFIRKKVLFKNKIFWFRLHSEKAYTLYR